MQRVLDNPALLASCAAANGDGVWPVFCLDPRLLRPNASAEPNGAKTVDTHRVRFLLQSIVNLRARLLTLGAHGCLCIQLLLDIKCQKKKI